jgi:hypothetical protein
MPRRAHALLSPEMRPRNPQPSPPVTTQPPPPWDAERDFDTLPFRLDCEGGVEIGSARHQTSEPATLGEQKASGTGALTLQVAADVSPTETVFFGVFGTFGLGVGLDTFFLGARGGYRVLPTLRLALEIGGHSFFDIDRGVFSSSDIPGVTVPFAGARVDWTPGRRFASFLLSFVVRADLAHQTTEGTVTSPQFLDKDRVEMRSYSLGGVTVGLMGGVSFDFFALGKRRKL